MKNITVNYILYNSFFLFCFVLGMSYFYLHKYYELKSQLNKINQIKKMKKKNKKRLDIKKENSVSSMSGSYEQREDWIFQWDFKGLIGDSGKQKFFEFVAMSVLLYGCTTWTHIKS